MRFLMDNGLAIKFGVKSTIKARRREFSSRL
jgi:hypothetical protein